MTIVVIMKLTVIIKVSFIARKHYFTMADIIEASFITTIYYYFITIRDNYNYKEEGLILNKQVLKVIMDIITKVTIIMAMHIIVMVIMDIVIMVITIIDISIRNIISIAIIKALIIK